MDRLTASGYNAHYERNAALALFSSTDVMMDGVMTLRATADRSCWKPYTMRCFSLKPERGTLPNFVLSHQ